MSRRERKLLRKKGKKYRSDRTIEESGEGSAEHVHVRSRKKQRNRFLEFYDTNYKKNMWITIVMLVLAIIVVGVHTAMTGEFIPRGVSLKGGVTITVPFEEPLDTDELQAYLLEEHPDASLTVRAMSRAGTKIGFIVDASDVDAEELLVTVQKRVGNVEKFSIETMGSALGNAFFKQTLLAILVAFILMSVVVFLSFKTLVPSGAVILSAVSDIMMTIAVIDIIGMKIETAGIAALLMLIGYSVDTDVLLTTRVVKREEGTVFDRVMGAMKTGVTMTVTSIVAVTVSLIFTQSETLKQIMIILLIGLLFDLLNTWIQNVGILRIYMERKAKKKTADTLAEYREVVDADFEETKDEPAKEHKHEQHHKAHERHAHHKHEK
ncbi:protein translocase subunit SecF [Nanoarchaeota archaeon]